MKKLNIREVSLKNGYKFIGHARVRTSNGVEEITPVGPGLVCDGESYLFAEKVDWDGSASGAYLLSNVKEGYREVGFAERNRRHGAVLRTAVSDTGIEYGHFSIMCEGVPNGYFLTFSGSRARVDRYNNGCLKGRCLLFDGGNLHLGVNTSDGTKKILGQSATGIIGADAFCALRLCEVQFGESFDCRMDGESRERCNGLGANLSSSSRSEYGFFKDGLLDGLGIRKTKESTILGSFKGGSPDGACIVILGDGAARAVFFDNGTATDPEVKLPTANVYGMLSLTCDNCKVQTDFFSTVDYRLGSEDGRLNFDQNSSEPELKRLPSCELNYLHGKRPQAFFDARTSLVSADRMNEFKREKPKVNFEPLKSEAKTEGAKPTESAASPDKSKSGGTMTARVRSERSAPTPRAHGDRSVSAVEIICTVAMLLLVGLALSGVTNTLIQAIEKFIFSTYPSYYDFSLMELAEEWLNQEIDAFFLLVPIIWLVKIITAALSFIGQMLMYVLLAIGHVIIFILGMSFNIIIIYLAAPAITVLLIVRAVRNRDVSSIWFILSIVMTILYYLFSIATVR